MKTTSDDIAEVLFNATRPIFKEFKALQRLNDQARRERDRARREANRGAITQKAAIYEFIEEAARYVSGDFEHRFPARNSSFTGYVSWLERSTPSFLTWTNRAGSTHV